MNAKGQTAPPTQLNEAELRHYTPEEVYELGLLPFKPSTLRKKAQAYEIPHSRAGGKITFKLWQIRQISEQHDAWPVARTHSTDQSVQRPAA